MKLLIIGAGYVGLVSAACFAKMGHEVYCTDNDRLKIESLKDGEIPFYEPGLSELIRDGKNAGLLKFSNDLTEGLIKADLIFICVGTPSQQNGQADLRCVFEVVREIGEHLDHRAIIAIKSTVPVGTSQAIKKLLRQYRADIEVVFCPEFLKEGTAIDDFLNPDRLIIGTDSEYAQITILAIHEKINCPKVLTDYPTSEMIKYSSNAFLATKISFINEIANICENVGADVEQVAEGMGLDKRICKYFLKAGIGYGGSCFPKDVRALHRISEQTGYSFQILKATEEVNRQQRWRFYKKIRDNVGCLKSKTIGVWGLSFKPDTDDVRESIAIDIIEKLIEDGAKIRVYDPRAMKNAEKILGSRVDYCFSAVDAVENTDVILIITEWDEFKNFDFNIIKNKMPRPIIIDGRNLFAKDALPIYGLKYISIGR